MLRKYGYGARRASLLGGLGVILAGLVAACGQLPFQAQPPPKVYRIGYLTAINAAVDAPRLEGLRRGLRDLGWIEGQNIVIEGRWADGQMERLPDLAVQLTQLQPDVIVTFSEPVSRAMKNATGSIPIVFAAHGDPVGTQLVASLARPGGNVTGVTEMAPQLAGKRLELLKQAMPAAARVGALWNENDQAMVREYGETLVAAQTLGLELQSLGVRTPGDLDAAYQAATEGRMDGVVVLLDPLIARSRDRLVELSTKSGLPTMSGDATFAAAGGLMSYGASVPRQTQRAAYYVDRILKGAKPADLPVEQPMLFDFVVNLSTARAVGVTFPNDIMLQVTEVVQ